MNGKLVRGLRRRYRGHLRRAATPIDVDLTALTRWHVAAHQIGIAPWCDQQKPPVHFRQLWVKRLLTDLPHWQQPLTPYEGGAYVAVWLFEPRFGLSQLVAAVADRKQDYERLFGPVQARVTD